MDEPFVDPIIDAAVKKLEERTSATVACPICHSTKWGLLNPERFLRLQAPSELTDAEIDSLDEGSPESEVPYETLRVLVYCCERCAFLRTHLFSDAFGEPEPGTS